MLGNKWPRASVRYLEPIAYDDEDSDGDLVTSESDDDSDHSNDEPL